jgi:hypothetical protein
MTQSTPDDASDVAPALPPDASSSSQLQPAGAGNVLVTVGDIACTQTTVITPNGSHPLAGTTWIVANNSSTKEKIPTYAIVLAVIFALACLLGLLFLLIKERIVEGYVQVSVQGPNLFYATQVQIHDPQQVADVEQRVNYIRSLVAALPR